MNHMELCCSNVVQSNIFTISMVNLSTINVAYWFKASEILYANSCEGGIVVLAHCTRRNKSDIIQFTQYPNFANVEAKTISQRLTQANATMFFSIKSTPMYNLMTSTCPF